MAPSDRPPHPGGRPKQKTPAERSDEYTALQRQMKQDAAERREQAAKAGAKPAPRPTQTGSSSRPAKRSRTP
jgi:hypothetical protein